jgi:hypothetical protein
MTTISISDELASLKKNFSNIQITSATSHFLTFTYERTVHARVKATLTFPEDYPSHALLVSVSMVAPGLQKKLERELGNVAQNLALSSSLPQVEEVVRHLLNFMDTNKFVPCWKELKQVVGELMKDNDKSTIVSLNERKGRMQLRFNNGKYYYACSITVDDNYPSTTTHENWGNACKLVLKESNFGTKIESLLTLQAKELVRHMQDGMSAEKALAYSNPIKAPPTQEYDDDDQQRRETNVDISRNAIKGLPTKQGNAHDAKDHSVKGERNEWHQEEQRRLEAFQLEDHADPQPSLFQLISFLRCNIQQLPEKKCPICQQLALPTNPEDLGKMYTSRSNQSKQNLPLLTYCGCWYHYGCLHKFMVEPPFGAPTAACPSCCGKRVYHPNWPADSIKELERDWANKQARQRDIEDAAMFF